MRSRTSGGLGAILALLVGWLPLAGPATAAAGTATILHPRPDSACAGEAATLVWSPPDGVSAITGYQITRQLTTPSTPQFTTTYAGAEETSLAFTVPFGLSNYQIRTITAAGVDPEPFASPYIMGNQAPRAMGWDTVGARSVGDGTATVPYKWYGPLTWSTTGGLLPATIRVTESPGSASITSAAPEDPYGVALTFTGLTNGVEHTFSGVTSNACGSSAPYSSPRYVPGVGPTWTTADPPLSVRRNKGYRSQFTASGTPTPGYRLVGAPAWLKLGPTGLVEGEPPRGTTSFTYSIAASNGVGIESGLLFTDIQAGPFTVQVTK